MICVFLNDGFEDIEALATVDILRRAKIDVKTVGISKRDIISKCGVTVKSDIIDTDLDINTVDAVILPGGPGTKELEKSDVMRDSVFFCHDNGKLIAAICAAPSILGHMGLLNGIKSTCFPGYERELKGAIIQEESVVCDKNIITAKGAGVTIDFALRIVEELTNKELSETIYENMQCDRR